MNYSKLNKCVRPNYLRRIVLTRHFFRIISFLPLSIITIHLTTRNIIVRKVVNKNIYKIKQPLYLEIILEIKLNTISKQFKFLKLLVNN